MSRLINILKRLPYLAGCSIFGLTIFNGAVGAQSLSPTDQNILYNDTVWYDNTSVPTSSGSSLCNSSVSPGNGAPDGAAFPNLNPAAMANAINTWIKQQNPNSKLSGLGSTIVADAKNSNVNPFLIVAIAKEESSLSDPSDYNVQNGNNSFGRTATSSQPHFSGAHLWYKWSSVEVSVDYTAPENQNISGGGDMATYLRDQYGSQLDSNNLSAMILQYAPPGENDTASYILNIQSWISDLINLTNGSSNGSSNSGGQGGTTTQSGGNCSVQAVNCNSSGQPGAGNTNSGLSTVRQNVVCIAEQELALWESQPGYPWNGENSYSETGYLKYSQGSQEEWCSDFATWVYDQAGYPLQPDPGWRIAYVPNVQSVGEQNQNFHWHPQGDGYVPKPGDLAIHGPNHINIFISSQGGTSQYIGGDQGNGPYPGGSIVSIETGSGYYDNGITGYVSPD